MRKLVIFAAGITAGVAIASLHSRISVLAQAAAPSGNGDVNGDGEINLADAVHLLNWLFKGGAPPVPIECEEPAGPTARFRLLNDLVCQDVPFQAQMEVCGVPVTDSFEEGNLPTACTGFAAKSGCAVRLVATTVGCGAFDFCGTFDAQPNRVYDFTLTVVENNRLALGYVVQDLPASGECPPFPTGGTFAGEIIGTCVPGAQVPAGAGGAQGFTAGSWGQ